MKIEALKEKARRHEQKEEWQKALDLYQEALLRHDEDEPPDITLYNRVGDIQIRVGQTDGAVKSYEKAIDLYMEAELPNNAIAICKKVLRNLPGQNVFFLRMGQIRGSQGFLTDARQNFLTYAERMTEEGDIDAALDALVEFVALAPEDLEIRMGLAAQLESHDRVEEAVEQYADAYKHLILQDQEAEAEGIAERVRELSPDTMLPDAQSIRAGVGAVEEEGAFEFGSSLAGMELDFPRVVDDEPSALEKAEAEYETQYGEIILGREKGVEEPVDVEASEEVEAPEEMEVEALPTFGLDGEEEEEDDEAEPLPTLGFDDEDEDEDEEEALPTFDHQEEEEEALPTFGFEEEEEEAPEPLPTFGFQEEGEPAPEGSDEDAPALAAADSGDADPGDREGREYVESQEDLPELEFDLEGPSLDEAAEEAPEELEAALLDESPVEAQEEEAVTVSPPKTAAEALEEAAEDAALEAARLRGPTTHQEAADEGDLDLAMDLVQAEIDTQPDDVELHQRKVEYAFRTGNNQVLIGAYMDLAQCLIRTQATAKAKAIFQQILSLAPDHDEARQSLDELEGVSTPRRPRQVASSEEYVDLGSMILGNEPEKTTRWQVAADAPSGDEQADFAKMLSQFKDKVSEHVDADDVTAHHDLGTAYMEMGLFEEAISEFQMALRAAPGHLPTHEVMGRCWMEYGQPEMASRALRRALEVEFDVEDELIGIYYLMGRAQEDLGNPEEAVEFYEKVFSLDINFEDVTERLRALR